MARADAHKRTYWASFAYPYRTSTLPFSSEVPGRFHVALNGRGYMLDLKSGDFGMQSIPLSRVQSDTSDTPSEASLSRDDLWRRALESRHHGAGQIYFDRPTSDQYRFRSSLGVDVWTRDSLTLLNGVAALPLFNTSQFAINTGTHLYIGGGGVGVGHLDWSTTGGPGVGEWTSVSISATAVTGLVSDGTSVYFSSGNEIRSSVIGSTVAAVYNTLDAGLLGFVNGRLMAVGTGANAHHIYNVISAAAPTFDFAHPNPAWTWTAFAGGPKVIYAAGYAGGKSSIYEIPILANGTGLDTPVVALTLPDGEIALSLEFYLGFLAIGTNRGLRIAAAGDTLTVGPFLPVGPVYCIDGDDRWLWFGWTNYDAAHTGLGRAGIVPGIANSAFTDTLTPAYASDVMALAQGIVTATTSFAGKRVFCTPGDGPWVETSTPLPSGTIDSGWITYGLPDRKILEWVDIRSDPLAGTVTVAVAGNAGTFTELLPVLAEAGTTGVVAVANEIDSDRFELRITLTSAAGLSPNVVRVTLQANPTPARGVIWSLPLLLHERQELVNGSEDHYDASTERSYIAVLTDNGTLVTFQVGADAYLGFIEDFIWRPQHPTVRGDDWNGTELVTLKVPARRTD